MENDQLASELEKLLNKIDEEVILTFQYDRSLGIARWESWVRLTKHFFEVNLPNYLINFNNKVDVDWSERAAIGQLTSTTFLRYIRLVQGFIKSLIVDVKQGELILPVEIQKNEKLIKSSLLRKAFIVHGHDDSTKLRTARFLEKLGFEAVILHEQASSGKTIIEKLEHFTDVGFGIVLYTPDDVGQSVNKQDNLLSRARQNVVFEHGLLLGKLGRGRVLPLVTDNSIDLPGDISGMVYMSDKNWEIDLAKEIKALGYDVDLNKLF